MLDKPIVRKASRSKIIPKINASTKIKLLLKIADKFKSTRRISGKVVNADSKTKANVNKNTESVFIGK